MLKLFTDTTFLTEQYRKQVFPLLFDLYFVESKTLLQYYMLSSDVIESDVVVFPIDYSKFLSFKSNFSKLQQIAQENNKPIWIYSSGDYGFTNYIKNSFTFRLGGFHSKMNSSNYIMPVFINDPYTIYTSHSFSSLQKENQPSVGFVGHAKGGVVKYLKELLSYTKYRFKRGIGRSKTDFQPFYPSSIKRASFLRKLQFNSGITTNFIFRNKYRAGVETKKDKVITTNEFYDNVYHNIYTFCLRGIGNFSVRFYETLAMGRIPVLLNTDCRLPFSDKIDWNNHCVIVNKPNKLATEILEFHNSKSKTEIETIQKSNRLLWDRYLTRKSYFINIHNIFIKDE
ncbi:exostosin domain-containing protein [Hyunsoonleella ulvae]|uniref:exostosin domain-containing protein n=1 Tax=Hyunsoonleella ulvae TaxID=2799948 RepID=UPI001939F9F0|nr:exostosin family protein [Hyunsoonleella ulvae]